MPQLGDLVPLRLLPRFVMDGPSGWWDGYSLVSSVVTQIRLHPERNECLLQPLASGGTSVGKLADTLGAWRHLRPASVNTLVALDDQQEVSSLEWYRGRILRTPFQWQRIVVRSAVD
jgi:hypothetical protein